ncbi:MAG: type IV pilin [Thermoplasmataceae archaeon]
MKEVAPRKDNAVSPIIATILLIAITVTLASTLYSIVGGYFSNTPTLTPNATISVLNKTTVQANGTGTGEYQVYVESISGNLSLNSVKMMITFNTGNISTLSINDIGPAGTQLYSGITVTMIKQGPDFSPLDFISVNEQYANQFVQRISFIDTATSGVIGTAYPQ